MASVERLPDTRKGTPWRARVRLPGGKVQSRTFYSERQARDWAATLEGDKVRGALPANLSAGRVKFRDWADEWLETRDLRDSTRAGYRGLLDLWLLPELGDVPLSKITPERVRRWHSLSKRKAVAKGSGAVQVPKAYRVLHAMLETAVTEELLARNPCRIRGAGEEPKRERPLLDLGELWTLAEWMGRKAPHLRALVLTAGLAGLRRGELLGLQRRDVNLLNGTLRVERQADHNRRLSPPKTDAGVRTVRLAEVLTEELRAHLEEHTSEEPEAFVFVGDLGGPLSVPTLDKWWRLARAECGLEWVRLHDLRHAAATNYAALGSSVRELQSFGGWSSPAAALRYLHTSERRTEELAARMGELAVAARDGERTNVVDLGRARNAREAVASGGGATPPRRRTRGNTRVLSGAGDGNRTRITSLEASPSGNSGDSEPIDERE